MKVEEIKSAVRAGKTVFWRTKTYRVIEDKLGQWFINCDANRSVTPLLATDGKLNGNENSFFVGDDSGSRIEPGR